jgi:hypothetical protein
MRNDKTNPSLLDEKFRVNFVHDQKSLALGDVRSYPESDAVVCGHSPSVDVRAQLLRKASTGLRETVSIQ